ncbi:MAG: 16S rRNA (guanine(966)-N(2))-methyltransferase RsmD [Bacteroidota bacterium]
MRIISGFLKGKQLRPPAGLPVRPTTDFAKEALFNILNNYIDFEDLKVLDLFAGTGNISYELASRGVAKIISVDSNPKCVAYIKQQSSALNLSIIDVMKTDVFRYLEKADTKFDLIFADPPYNMTEFERIPKLVFERGMLNADGWLVVEHSAETILSKVPFFKEKRTYGNVNFSLFQNS